MKIAVEGCCHGELDKIYETLQHMERANNTKVDLLLICGDFQAVRNRGDLDSMAVPAKYQKLNTFYKYYSGEKVAPVLTIFIGGNHEASNYMQELTYGGWVAENIFYMGYANVVQVGGLRIGGLSGIYKDRDYFRGHYEHPPYNGDTKRSVYHIRNIEVFRLKQLIRPLDIFMSHDWPSDIARYGNMEELFRRKPFLREEVLDGSLGSPPAAKLLQKLQPSYWFSAHLHVKYTAHVQHPRGFENYLLKFEGNVGGNATKFLSLDKCLPRRKFLQILDFPDKGNDPVKISLDPEWLCVLQKTNHLMHIGKSPSYMPEGTSFEVSDDEVAKVVDFFEDLAVQHNFKPTAPTLAEEGKKASVPAVIVNPQTALLCTLLDLKDPNAIHLGISSHQALSLNPEQLKILDGSYGSDRSDASDDDVPTDVSSSFNSSTVSSSMETSYSSASPFHPKLPHNLSASAATAPLPQVEDDDEEFQAILAAQRRNSQQMTPPVKSQAEQKKDSSLEGEQKISLPSSPKTDDADDELASIIAAQRQRSLVSSENTQKLKDDANVCGEKSSSDLESTSQDSQDDLDQPGYLGDSSQASTTDCVEVSTSSDSPSQGGQQDRRTAKHPSPSNLSPVHASVKKLKRRNVSMYTSSGTEEEEPC